MRPSRGFAAISAVFILVVLAGLGVALVTISSGQQRSQAYDVLGMKAYQAAHAGIENALYEVLRNGACPGTPSYPLTGSLSDFSVQIDCTPSAAVNDGGSITIYDITATSCNRPSATPPPLCPGTPGDGYVERELRASVCRGTAC
jgi:MSHA biogenesis protein MshP